MNYTALCYNMPIMDPQKLNPTTEPLEPPPATPAGPEAALSAPVEQPDLELQPYPSATQILATAIRDITSSKLKLSIIAGAASMPFLPEVIKETAWFILRVFMGR